MSPTLDALDIRRGNHLKRHPALSYAQSSRFRPVPLSSDTASLGISGQNSSADAAVILRPQYCAEASCLSAFCPAWTCISRQNLPKTPLVALITHHMSADSLFSVSIVQRLWGRPVSRGVWKAAPEK